MYISNTYAVYDRYDINDFGELAFKHSRSDFETYFIISSLAKKLST